MSKLKVVNVGRMTAFRYGDDMVNARRKRIGIAQTEIHRMTADAADFLRGVNNRLGLVELPTVRAVLVGSVSVAAHAPPPFRLFYRIPF